MKGPGKPVSGKESADADAAGTEKEFTGRAEGCGN